MKKTSFIFVAILLASFFQSCEEDSLGVVKVDFGQSIATIASEADGNWENTITLAPAFNISEDDISEAEWTVTYASNYFLSTETPSSYEEIPVESVTFNPATALSTELSVEYRGIYIIKLTIKDKNGNEGYSTIRIDALDTDLDPGPLASSSKPANNL